MRNGAEVSWRAVAVAAVLVDAAGVVLYLAVIDAQGTESVTDREIVGWAAAMALPGVLCAIAAAVPARQARWLLAAAVLPAAGLGLLAIFSVGLVFLVVAGLAMTAAVMCLVLGARSQLRQSSASRVVEKW